MHKKAQTVPAMIVLIIIFFLLYVYIMPLSEKCRVMPDIKECQSSVQEEDRIARRNLAEIVPVTLLEDEPGFLPIQEKYAVYSVRPIDIFNTEEIEVATLLEKEEVKRDWFYSYGKKGAFSIHNRSVGVRMFIYISKGKGNLKIDINPDAKFVIQEKDLEKEMPLEVYIPAENLDNLNVIRLSVSSPVTPFEQNSYEIEKIIVKEVYRLTDNSIESTINIKEDLTQISQAFLYFNPDCITKEKLSVELNGKELKDETLCQKELIDITDNIEENNLLTFSTNGNYFIFPTKLHLKFKQLENSVFYFDINEKEYSQIEQGIALILLDMKFDSTENKKIDVYINKQLFEIDTDDLDYETTIKDYVKEGENILEISAKTDTKVDLLKVHIR